MSPPLFKEATSAASFIFGGIGYAFIIAMTATSGSHITPLDNAASAHMFEVGSAEKANGNNVDLEREMTEITKNGLQYITLVQYLNQKIKTLRSSITGGGQG